MKKRALLSVYDKNGILDLARFLRGADWEILSTGGTHAFLKQNGVTVTDVVSVTGFPECLDGRVKTLHPAIHAGLLARREEASHRETLDKLNLDFIDLVAVNLYPFFDKVCEGALPFEEMIEFIDIGGPAMLRSAAKNCAGVIVLTDTTDYAPIIEEMQKGDTLSLAVRRRLAGKVFNLTSAYDAAVSRYLLATCRGDEAGRGVVESASALPLEKRPRSCPEGGQPPLSPRVNPEESPWGLPFWSMAQKKAPSAQFPPLRYGENAHQKAALYLSADRPGALAAMEQLSGKAMGYNNIRDLDLAWKAVSSFSGDPAWTDAPVAAVAVKHVSPCGIALGKTPLEAYMRARACDPVSIFGGVVAVNAKIDADCARKMAETFLEIVVAPDYAAEAVDILRKRKDLRIIKAPRAPHDPYEIVSVDGGILVEECDTAHDDGWNVVTKREPDPRDIADLRFAMRAVRWVRSNAIVVAKDLAAVGIGGGETNRLSAARLALERAAGSASNARVLASDAFFPFPDTVEAAAERGITSIIQPGGSIKDRESIDACDRLGLAMIFTGMRHFRH
ncbi:MAG: bifunctional phosphoribosylaminoimidazolecarboxamide formyltransferase/IMP cyclohydrolase [Spirochaetaceae bacterium]|jgi:phosphoribosylaminoimidazolecarboxamide formyltransferase/IMP cyclohydrolase|nr:bifunctional phosphoribosylaminoimidazolecarboxamide formyltransferase/IMP cyclohydrolase [Spirochaetaceae bacterium]